MEQWNNENTEYTNQTIIIKQGRGKMLEKEKNQHKGCPNRGHCQKEESKKGLTIEEIEDIEYKQAKLDNETIDDFFAEVEDIDEIPIISIDSEKEQ